MVVRIVVGFSNHYICIAVAIKMKNIRYELILWLMYVSSVIPGRIGCAVRNFILPYKRGKKVLIWEGVHIDSPSRLVVGNNVSINRNCTINAGGHVEIKDNTLIGPRVTIYSQNHKFSSKNCLIREQGYAYKKVVIGPDVWIASNAVILPGVVIGEGSVIAAGSIVSRSVPPYSVVAGVPAKVIGTRT